MPVIECSQFIYNFICHDIFRRNSQKSIDIYLQLWYTTKGTYVRFWATPLDGAHRKGAKSDMDHRDKMQDKGGRQHG